MTTYMFNCTKKFQKVSKLCVLVEMFFIRFFIFHILSQNEGNTPARGFWRSSAYKVV